MMDLENYHNVAIFSIEFFWKIWRHDWKTNNGVNKNDVMVF
jgi:hypothetical protein